MSVLHAEKQTLEQQVNYELCIFFVCIFVFTIFLNTSLIKKINFALKVAMCYKNGVSVVRGTAVPQSPLRSRVRILLLDSCLHVEAINWKISC